MSTFNNNSDIWPLVDNLIDKTVATSELDYGDVIEDVVVALMLREILFLNCFEISRGGKFHGETAVLFVNLLDIFMWGCSDAESITTDELPELYRLVRKYKYGLEIWACRKRGMQPQRPIKERMQLVNEWLDDLELLTKPI
jgi:hypothetical protein